MLSVLIVSPVAAQAPPAAQATLWVFAVGVSHYRNSMIDLQFADNDAQTLATSLKDRGKRLFADVKTQVLVNDQVTKQSILEGMNSFFSAAKPDDTGVIALMGHGVIADGTFYFLPNTADVNNLKTQGLRVQDFESAVQGVSERVKWLALMLDTCHAQALNVHVRGLSDLNIINQKARGVSLVSEVAQKVPDTFILGSSTEDENSWEDASYRLPGEKNGHGLFTYALLRGLNEAPAHKGVIEVGALYDYAADVVQDKSLDKQKPSHGGSGTNFPIARAVEPPPSADLAQAAALLNSGQQARQNGRLPQAQLALSRATSLNPNDQVAAVLSDEAAADRTYQASDAARDDVIAAAKLLKSSGYKGPIDPWAPRPMMIAFLDFVTAGGAYAGLHDALVARLSQELQGSKRVQIVDRHLIAAVLREQKLSMTDLSNPATRLNEGRILVSRLIGTGDVAEIGPDKYSVDLQMIDTDTTEVKINLSEPLNGSAGIVAAADKGASDILDQLSRYYPLKGKIAAVDNDRVVVDIGSSAGATSGTRLNAVVEKPITAGGQVLAVELSKIGSIEITEVQENGSFARILEHSAPLSVGTKVIEVSRSAGPAAAPRKASPPAPSSGRS